MLGDADSLQIDQARDHEETLQSVEPPPTPARRGRKRKNVEDPVSFFILYFYSTNQRYMLPLT